MNQQESVRGTVYGTINPDIRHLEAKFLESLRGLPLVNGVVAQRQEFIKTQERLFLEREIEALGLQATVFAERVLEWAGRTDEIPVVVSDMDGSWHPKTNPNGALTQIVADNTNKIREKGGVIVLITGSNFEQFKNKIPKFSEDLSLEEMGDRGYKFTESEIQLLPDMLITEGGIVAYALTKCQDGNYEYQLVGEYTSRINEVMASFDKESLASEYQELERQCSSFELREQKKEGDEPNRFNCWINLSLDTEKALEKIEEFKNLIQDFLDRNDLELVMCRCGKTEEFWEKGTLPIDQFVMNVDMVPKGLNKGFSLEYIKDLISIMKICVWTIGNGGNDIQLAIKNILKQVFCVPSVDGDTDPIIDQWVKAMQENPELGLIVHQYIERGLSGPEVFKKAWEKRYPQT